MYRYASTARAALVAVPTMLFLLLFGVGIAAAAGNAGNVKVVNSVCQPPGPGVCTGQPQLKGRNGYPCPVKNLKNGYIMGACINGVCSVTAPSVCVKPSFTDSATAAKTGGLGQALGQMFGQLLQQLLQGGGGGGGGQQQPQAPPPPNFSYGTGGTQDDSLLTIDTGPLGDTEDDFNLDAIFGDDTTDEGDSGGDVITDENGDTGIDTDGDGVVDTPAPGQEGDTVVTTYEYTEAVGENPIVGDGLESDTFTQATEGEEPFGFDADTSEFDADFASANLDPGDDSVTGSGLSLEELEAQGLLEAYRLGANGETHSGSLSVPYESLTPAEIRTLRDYHSSAVAVSGKLSPFQGNPLSNEQYDSAPAEEQSLEERNEGVFSKVLKFIAALFGLGPPQN